MFVLLFGKTLKLLLSTMIWVETRGGTGKEFRWVPYLGTRQVLSGRISVFAEYSMFFNVLSVQINNNKIVIICYC